MSLWSPFHATCDYGSHFQQAKSRQYWALYSFGEELKASSRRKGIWELYTFLNCPGMEFSLSSCKRARVLVSLSSVLLAGALLFKVHFKLFVKLLLLARLVPLCQVGLSQCRRQLVVEWASSIQKPVLSQSRCHYLSSSWQVCWQECSWLRILLQLIFNLALL